MQDIGDFSKSNYSRYTLELFAKINSTVGLITKCNMQTNGPPKISLS